jgi:hypothetical protein
MKTNMKEAEAILGNEILTVFKETFGDDPKALQEIISEALRAMKLVNLDEDYNALEVNNFGRFSHKSKLAKRSLSSDFAYIPELELAPYTGK